jgi:hypothetical protein
MTQVACLHRARVTVFIMLISACVGWQAPQEPKPDAAALQLELVISKVEVIRGESLPFEIILANAGADPITLSDGSPQNRAFGIRITGRGGFQASGDTMSVAAREGERVDAVRAPVKKELAAGDKLSVKGDLLAWLGDLEPGEYNVAATYSDPAPVKAESTRVAVRVTPASPLYARAARPNWVTPQQSPDVVWTSRTDSGGVLYLLESSSKNAAVTLSNRPIASVSATDEPVASTYASVSPKQQSVVWIPDPDNLQVMRLTRDAIPGSPATLPLPEKGMKILDTPYTDDNGRLHLVLVSADGKRAGLLQCPPDGGPTWYPIQDAPPLSAQRAVQWYKDGVFALVWSVGRVIYAASAELESLPTAIPARKVLTLPFSVTDIALGQRYNQTRQLYDRLLVMMAFDRVHETLFIKRADMRTGNPEPDERFVIPGLNGMSFFKSVLKEDLTPVYAFFDPEGGLWIAQPRLARLTPVSDGAGAPVKRDSFPELILPSRSSRLQGIFIRYLDGGKKLAVTRIR